MDLVLDRLPCGWLSMSEQGLLIAVNEALCRMAGIPANALKGQPFDSLLTRASRVLYQSYLQPLLQLHGHVEELALTLAGTGGANIDVLVYTTKPSGQAAVAIEMVLAPIRMRRRIEDEMLRIKRAADLAPGLIFQLMEMPDGRQHFPYASEAIRRLYGVTAEEARTRADTVFDQVDSQDRAAMLEGMRQCNLAGQEWSGVYRVTDASGAAQWHEMHATPRQLANGVTLWHGHVADVTTRREMEAALADKQAIERAHKARSEFLARVSHELRTPLNGILGFAQLLKSDNAQPLTAEQRDRVNVIHSSGRHLLQLINEVLDVTTLEAGRLNVKVQELELRQQLQAATRIVEPLALGNQVCVLPIVCPPGLTVLADEQRLQQVLVNLLSNAIKYNRPQGTVQVGANCVDGTLRVEVMDSGAGLTPQQQAQLFQPFNRLGAETSATEGHGLGLVITKHLLELMGGSISVQSAPGQGTTFAFTLPAGALKRPSPPLGGGPQVQPPVAVAPTQTSGSVLYVEDNEVNAALMEAIVGLRPAVELRLAETGASGLKAALAKPPDLLLLDLNLPDTNGLDLLSAMREHASLQDVPAVMVSAAARADDIALARQRGFVAYWTKPLDVDRTLEELDHWLVARIDDPADAND